MSDELKAVKEELSNQVSNLRETMTDKTDAQIKTAIDKFSTDYNASMDKINELQAKQTASIESLEAKYAEKNFQSDPEKEAKESQSMFVDWVRTGIKGESKSVVRWDSEQAMRHLEGKANPLASDQGSTGGYLRLAPVVASKIESAVLEVSPIRQNANVETISSDMYEVVKETGAFAESDREERGSVSTTAAKDFGLIRIPTNIRYAEPKITQKMLRVARIDMENWIRTKVALRFAKAENADFCTGDGDTQPMGLMNVSDGEGANVTNVNSGNGSTMPDSADKFIDMWKAGKSIYNYKWYFNRNTIAEIFKYKDGNDRYLLQNSIDGAFPFSLLGSPIIEVPDFADISGGAYVGLYSDLKAAYTIIDNPGITMIRDEITSKGNVLFYFEKSSGGGIVQPEAMIRLKISA